MIWEDEYFFFFWFINLFVDGDGVISYFMDVGIEFVVFVGIFVGFGGGFKDIGFVVVGIGVFGFVFGFVFSFRFGFFCFGFFDGSCFGGFFFDLRSGSFCGFGCVGFVYGGCVGGNRCEGMCVMMCSVR